MTNNQSIDKAVDEVNFTTKDLNQAAFYWCQEGAELIDLRGSQKGRRDGTTVFFCFHLKLSEEEIGALQLRFANGKCTVEPNQFVAKQNALRDLLYNCQGIQTRRNDQMTGEKLPNGNVPSAASD